MDFTYTILIPLIPLFSFLIIGFLHNKLSNTVASGIGITALTASFVMSYYTAYKYFFTTEKIDGAYQKIIGYNTVWLQFTENLHIDMGTLIDPISVMMLVVVSTVSLMVHIYSTGYMKGEDGFNRFYSFLSLFSFSMFGLVVSTNIFQMYVFWELVGVSSFLLIGYYYDKPSAVAASKKAFIVTRFADMFFLIGILTVGYITDTYDFLALTDPSGSAIAQGGGILFMGMSTMTWALILIFMGGAGKSAMMPFHIWLPDAMEGPTPVSALIHAATMVVAGVYLVARLFPVYSISAPDALEVVAYVGAISSLFAAIVATTQFDIKRVLAFSTMSQIGYMITALGVSGMHGHEGVGYMASMFHLFTHAMFKALLFLGAGAVIHAVHSNLMNEMGGLRKYLPVTHITFLIATLTIAGVPPLSGFFSKDEILVAAFHHDKFIFFIQLFVAGLTAFYMFRLYFRVFWNKEPHYHHTPHDAPMSMKFPLMFLAMFSFVAGFLPFNEWITVDGKAIEIHTEWVVAIPATLFGLIGIAIAMVMYKKETAIPDKISAAFGKFYKWTFNKFYFDEIYMFVTHKIIFNIVSKSVAWFDRNVVDATMDGIGHVTEKSAEMIKGLQSGQIQKYGFVFISGAIIIAIAFILNLFY